MTVLIFHSRQELELQIVTLRAQGWSIHALTRHFQMGRNTIRRILRKNARRRDQGHDLLTSQKRTATPRSSKLDPFLPQIAQLLEEFPDITGERLFERLKDSGYDGGVSILRDRLHRLRPKPKREPTVRFETEPGVQGQMDWSPYAIRFTRTPRATVLCFSYILGFCRRQYLDFTLHRDFYTLIRRHQDAFAHFPGVPLQCLYDGEKTVILRWEAARPVFNPAFVAFITHYHCRPIACRPGRAHTKGKVEAPFQYVEKNLLNARKFENLEHLRATARLWLKEKSDMHIHDTTGRAPMELFLEQEQAALQSLPLNPYDCSEVALRVCRVDGFLEFQTNLYSVPYEYVADILTLKATEQEIFIYSQELLLLARHERLPKGAGKTVELPEHRQSKKIRYGLEPVRDAFLALGQAAQPFLDGLKAKYPRNPGFHARFILSLKERYLSQDIDSALRHARRYQAFDAKAIERILKAKAQPRSLESIRNEQAGQSLKTVLPQIQQRPLGEYAALLSREEPDVSEGKIPENPGPDLGQDPGSSEDPETV